MIKPCDPHASIGVVWHQDPAVDQETSAIGPQYAEECMKRPDAWRDRLKFRDGATPTEWILGVTPPAEANTADDMQGFSSKMWHVFLHSVRDIKNGAELGKPEKVTRDGVEYIKPSWLAGVMVGPLRRCALDLGVVAWAWNRLTEADAKNSSSP